MIHRRTGALSRCISDLKVIPQDGRPLATLLLRASLYAFPTLFTRAQMGADLIRSDARQEAPSLLPGRGGHACPELLRCQDRSVRTPSAYTPL